MLPPHKHYVPLLLIAILCAALYLPGLQGPMLLDDFPQLEGLMNHASHEFTTLLQEYLFSSSGPLGRPVSMLTFILNANLHGNSLWHWKLTNLLLHLVTTYSLYLLACQLLKTSIFTSKQQTWIAISVAAIWALHPLHVSTVLYTVQRMTILSTLFTTLGLAAYIIGRDRLGAGEEGRHWIVIALGICFPLAIFSKENALLIPLYLGLIEWLRFPNSRVHTSWEHLSLRDKRLAKLVIIIALTFALWMVISDFVGNGYAYRPFSLTERLLTEIRVLVFYLWGILAPSWSNLGFYHDDFPISRSLLNPLSTLYSLLLLCALLAFGILLRKRLPVASFGILLFFSSHLLESTIFPLELMFEHRNYLGSFGIILALVTVAIRYVQARRVLIFMGVSTIIALSLLLVQFSQTWGDSKQLDLRLYTAHPNSPSAIAVLADRLVDAGNPNMAFRILDRQDRAGFKLQQLIIRCRLSNNLEDSDLQELNKRLNSLILSYELSGLFELSNQGLDNKCHFSATLFTNSLEIAIDHSPAELNRQKLLVYKAYFQKKNGKLTEALSTLEMAFTTAPASPMPLFLAADWLLDAHDKTTAKQYYQRAISVSKPNKAITREYIAHFKIRFAEK